MLCSKSTVRVRLPPARTYPCTVDGSHRAVSTVQGVRADSQGHQLLLGGAQRQAEDHGFDLVTSFINRLGWIGAHPSPSVLAALRDALAEPLSLTVEFTFVFVGLVVVENWPASCKRLSLSSNSKTLVFHLGCCSIQGSKEWVSMLCAVWHAVQGCCCGRGRRCCS